MLDEQRRIIGDARALNPAAVAKAAAARKRRPWLGPSGKLMIIAADHCARGVLAAGDRPMAMASRADLLDRILLALSRPGVDGVLGTADIVDDLLLLGALDGKIVLQRVVEASTLPALLLGGEVGDRPQEMFGQWRKALAVDIAVSLMSR